MKDDRSKFNQFPHQSNLNKDTGTEGHQCKQMWLQAITYIEFVKSFGVRMPIVEFKFSLHKVSNQKIIRQNALKNDCFKYLIFFVHLNSVANYDRDTNQSHKLIIGIFRDYHIYSISREKLARNDISHGAFEEENKWHQPLVV